MSNPSTVKRIWESTGQSCLITQCAAQLVSITRLHTLQCTKCCLDRYTIGFRDRVGVYASVVFILRPLTFQSRVFTGHVFTRDLTRDSDGKSRCFKTAQIFITIRGISQCVKTNVRKTFYNSLLKKMCVKSHFPMHHDRNTSF